MTKSELIKEVSEKVQLNRTKTKEVLETILNTIKESTLSEGKVQLSEFGVFKKYESPERIGRNPKTGESVKIDAKKVIKFKAV